MSRYLLKCEYFYNTSLKWFYTSLDFDQTQWLGYLSIMSARTHRKGYSNNRMGGTGKIAIWKYSLPRTGQKIFPHLNFLAATMRTDLYQFGVYCTSGISIVNIFNNSRYSQFWILQFYQLPNGITKTKIYEILFPLHKNIVEDEKTFFTWLSPV